MESNRRDACSTRNIHGRILGENCDDQRSLVAGRAGE
jgi:hypothetical protein